MSLTIENLLGQFVCSFPSLEDNINEVISWLGGTYHHIVFGQVFNPYIKKILIDDISNVNEKTNVAQFLECMANSDDCSVRAVLTDSILEELLDNPDEFSQIEPHLLEKTVSYLPTMKVFFDFYARKQT